MQLPIALRGMAGRSVGVADHRLLGTDHRLLRTVRPVVVGVKIGIQFGDQFSEPFARIPAGREPICLDPRPGSSVDTRIEPRPETAQREGAAEPGRPDPHRCSISFVAHHERTLHTGARRQVDGMPSTDTLTPRWPVGVFAGSRSEPAPTHFSSLVGISAPRLACRPAPCGPATGQAPHLIALSIAPRPI